MRAAYGTAAVDQELGELHRRKAAARDVIAERLEEIAAIEYRETVLLDRRLTMTGGPR